MLGVYAGGWQATYCRNGCRHILGDVNTGLAVGATLELASHTMVVRHTRLHSPVPALNSCGFLRQGVETAWFLPYPLVFGHIPDVLARLSTTVLVHRADQCAEKEMSTKYISHLLGSIPWGLSRAIPIFLLLWSRNCPSFLDATLWLINGFEQQVQCLPGIAMLLSYLPLSNY